MIPCAAQHEESITKMHQADSVLAQHPTDASVQWELMRVLGKLTFAIPDTAAYFSKRLVKYARVSGDSVNVANGLQLFGNTCEANNRMDQAIEVYHAAVNALGTYPEVFEISPEDTLYLRALRVRRNIYNDMSIAYGIKGMHGRSLQYGIKQSRLNALFDDKMFMAHTLNNIGLRHSEMVQPERALENFREAVGYYKEMGADKFVGRAYTNMAIAFGRLAQRDSAEHYIQQGIAYARKHGEQLNLLSALNAYSYIMLRDKDYAMAFQYMDSTEVLAEQLNNEQYRFQVKVLRGLANAELNNDTEAYQ